MSLLREVKPRNARTARIVKAREPQLIESRKRVLLLHGSKCPVAVDTVLRTISTLTKPHSVLLTKKNADIHPFENASSLEFLAGKNECGVVVFGTHSKKRPNNITVTRIFDNKVLDMAELLLLNSAEEMEAMKVSKEGKLSVGVEMKPLILFAGSQWDDESVSESASLYRTLKSMLLDVFQGEEISGVDVAGLQYILMIATGETTTITTTTTASTSSGGDDPASKPVLHLRWYKIRTLRSQTPKIPRVELDPVGPSFDFRVGRHRQADQDMMKEAMKHARRPNESARNKKNIETDLVGDKLGRVHLGKQDLSQLQTRKMKGLKRSRDDDEEDGDTVMNGTGRTNSGGADAEESDLEDEGGMHLDNDNDEIDLEGEEEEEEDDDDNLSQADSAINDDDESSSVGGTGDEIDIDDSDDDDNHPDQDQDMNPKVMPKRQRIQ